MRTIANPTVEMDHDGYRQEPDESVLANSVAMTVLSYLSIDKTTVTVAKPSQGRLSITVPAPSKFAISCLAVGIGDKGHRMVAGLASAPWFSHLRRAVRGPSHATGHEITGMLNDVLEHMRGPHVVSVALPNRPNQNEVDAACTVGRAVRRRSAFAVVTVSQPCQAAMIHLGGAFDCLIQGDGSVYHHWYPSRTITEPLGGRPICYDLYDVCSLWAGRGGTFGIVDPMADALHVEISAEVELLAEVHQLASAKAARLDDPGRLSLFNVVAGVRSPATAVSFSDSRLIRQERAPERRQRKIGR